MTHVKIIIADDHTLFTDGIKTLLKEEPHIEVLDVAKDGKELLEILNKLDPDVILLDINMPKLNGLDALRIINMQRKSIRVVMLSTYEDEHLIQKAIEYGAKGYLLKNTTKQELLNCIDDVVKNINHFPKRITKAPVSSFDKHDNFIKQYQLTKRELEILHLIKQEYTNQQIASKLFLSIYTIETHRKNIMQKLHLNSPSALIKFIIENNL